MLNFLECPCAAFHQQIRWIPLSKSKNQKIEPPKRVRGDIARIYFYVQWAYQIPDKMSKRDEQLFKAWTAQDPLDAWDVNLPAESRKSKQTRMFWSKKHASSRDCGNNL